MTDTLASTRHELANLAKARPGIVAGIAKDTISLIDRQQDECPHARGAAAKQMAVNMLNLRHALRGRDHQ